MNVKDWTQFKKFREARRVKNLASEKYKIAEGVVLKALEMTQVKTNRFPSMFYLSVILNNQMYFDLAIIHRRAIEWEDVPELTVEGMLDWIEEEKPKE